MSEKYLWRFYWDCGRQGSVEGVFVATEKEVQDATGEYVYFGEILGKHSEVYGTLEEGEITKLDIDGVAVEKVTEVLGTTWSGYNPLSYIKHDCIKCEDSYTEDEIELINDEWICCYCKEEEEDKE